MEKREPRAQGRRVHLCLHIHRHRSLLRRDARCRRRIYIGRTAIGIVETGYATSDIRKHDPVSYRRPRHRCLRFCGKLVVVADGLMRHRRCRLLSIGDKGRRHTFGPLQEHTNVHTMRNVLRPQRDLLTAACKRRPQAGAPDAERWAAIKPHIT